jgi:N-acetyl-gamma-glutamyl-phosphate reductase
MGDTGRLPVGIAGASGYGGVQLVRLLMDHPGIELVHLGGDSSAGKPFLTFTPPSSFS